MCWGGGHTSSFRWLQPAAVSSIWRIVCQIKQSLCIYGYTVSMVTWICSYGDWAVPLVLFVFSFDYYQRWSANSHTRRPLPVICWRIKIKVAWRLSVHKHSRYSCWKAKQTLQYRVMKLKKMTLPASTPKLCCFFKKLPENVFLFNSCGIILY